MKPAVLLALALALVLSACGAQPAASAASAPEQTPPSAPAEPAATVGRLYTLPRTTGTGLGWNSGDAYYELAPSDADYDRSALVLKTDYAAGAQAPVCAVSGCDHDGERCPAWLADRERHRLLVRGGEVYLLYAGLAAADREAFYGQPWEEFWLACYQSLTESGALDSITDLDAYKQSVQADYELGRSPSYLEKISADGLTRTRVFTLSDEMNWNEVDFRWCDGAALYGNWVDPYQQVARELVRLDLDTGALTRCPLLDNEEVIGVEGSRFLTFCLASDEPLDPTGDPELYNARVQNADVEFGLLTFPTGEREVFYCEPYDRGAYHNGFLGARDGTMYCETSLFAEDGSLTGARLTACDIASGQTRLITQDVPSPDLWMQEDRLDALLPAGGRDPLRYLWMESGSGRRLFLDLETGAWQEITQQASFNGAVRAVTPLAQTGDGRWMLGMEFHTPGAYGRYNYAFLSPQDLFAGSTDYDSVAMWP